MAYLGCRRGRRRGGRRRGQRDMSIKQILLFMIQFEPYIDQGSVLL